ncbi:hypothetical protein ON010_g8339 [Phytophthora cinnamomi]|nr:hypothetical protein ON010_g8339 [Phytophthora cinnamomi]
MQRAFSQLAKGKTKKFVLTGADGNLGRVAADFMVDIAKPEEQVVITSYDLNTLPAESIISGRMLMILGRLYAEALRDAATRGMRWTPTPSNLVGATPDYAWTGHRLLT